MDGIEGTSEETREAAETLVRNWKDLIDRLGTVGAEAGRDWGIAFVAYTPEGAEKIREEMNAVG
jgi:hypothetical protein